MLFWLFANTKGGDEGTTLSVLDGCNESVNKALNQIRLYPMGSSYQSNNFYLFFRALICAMYLTDKANGKTEEDQFYLNIQGVFQSGWNDYQSNNPNRSKEELAIEYLTVVLNSKVFQIYPEIDDAFREMIQFTSARWGYVPSRSSSYQREVNYINQALSQVARYNRMARKTYFLSPIFNKRNSILIGTGIGLVLLGLTIRKKRKS